MSTQHSRQAMTDAVRDGVARALGAVAMMGIGLIHLLDLPGKLSETPYLAWMYIGLIVGSILVAGELVRTGAPRAWIAGALLAAGALVGFTLTRTVGLPQATGDIGNWSEPLGMASLFVEGSLIALGAVVVTAARTGAQVVAGSRNGLSLAA